MHQWTLDGKYYVKKVKDVFSPERSYKDGRPPKEKGIPGAEREGHGPGDVVN